MNELNNEEISSTKKGGAKYHLTLLMNLFFGMLGIHRIINKKFISGFIMFTLGLITLILWLITLLVDSTALYIITVIFIVGINIWKFIDMIFILASKFKNKDKEYITPNKPFFKVWSNILTICVIIISILTTSIIGIVSLFTTSSYNSDKITEEIKNCLEAEENEDIFKNEKGLDAFLEDNDYEKVNTLFPNTKVYQKSIDDYIFLEFIIYDYPDKSFDCDYTMSFRNEDEYDMFIEIYRTYEGYTLYMSPSFEEGFYIYVENDKITDVTYYSLDKYEYDYDFLDDEDFEDDYEDEYDTAIEVIDIFSIEYSNFVK